MAIMTKEEAWCDVCHKSYPPDTKKCPQCGFPIKVEDLNLQTSECPDCGRPCEQIRPGLKKCTYCAKEIAIGQSLPGGVDDAGDFKLKR